MKHLLSLYYENHKVVKLAHLRCGGLFSYHFTVYCLVVEKIIDEHFKKLQTKRLIVSCNIMLKIKNWPDNLPVIDGNFFALMLLCRLFLTLLSSIKPTSIFFTIF